MSNPAGPALPGPSTPPLEDDRELSEVEVAQALGMSRVVVSLLVSRGVIPSSGASRRVRASHVRAFAETLRREREELSHRLAGKECTRAAAIEEIVELLP